VRQQVIATLGRVEDLRESGQLERLLRSGARFAAKAIVVDAIAAGSVAAGSARRIGPALVFERLWEETGCREVVENLANSRRHDFALERAVFLTVLHRLFCGGSDRAADRWREDCRIEGVEGLDLHHLYRAMAWLGEELAEDQQDGATPFAPRCQCRAESPQKWRRKIPQSGGLAISRWRDRRLRFLAAGRGVSRSVESDWRTRASLGGPSRARGRRARAADNSTPRSG
jgi:hypothetical protein